MQTSLHRDHFPVGSETFHQRERIATQAVPDTCEAIANETGEEDG